MQVTRRLKAHALTAEQVEEAVAFRAVPMRLDRREAGRGRDFAREPRDDGGVSGVALPGQRERAIKDGFAMRGLVVQPLFVPHDGETALRDQRAACTIGRASWRTRACT